MIYGIEETTDRRHPDTVVRRFRSESAGRRWQQATIDQHAWAGAADPALPIGQQNFHRRLRRLYRTCPGYRASKREITAHAERARYRPWLSCVADIIVRHSKEIT